MLMRMPAPTRSDAFAFRLPGCIDIHIHIDGDIDGPRTRPPARSLSSPT